MNIEFIFRSFKVMSIPRRTTVYRKYRFEVYIKYGFWLEKLELRALNELPSILRPRMSIRRAPFIWDNITIDNWGSRNSLNCYNNSLDAGNMWQSLWRSHSVNSEMSNLCKVRVANSKRQQAYIKLLFATSEIFGPAPQIPANIQYILYLCLSSIELKNKNNV